MKGKIDLSHGLHVRKLFQITGCDWGLYRFVFPLGLNLDGVFLPTGALWDIKTISLSLLVVHITCTYLECSEGSGWFVIRPLWMGIGVLSFSEERKGHGTYYPAFGRTAIHLLSIFPQPLN